MSLTNLPKHWILVAQGHQQTRYEQYEMDERDRVSHGASMTENGCLLKTFNTKKYA